MFFFSVPKGAEHSVTLSENKDGNGKSRHFQEEMIYVHVK